MSTIRKKSVALALSGAVIALAIGAASTPAFAGNDRHHGWGPPGHHKHHHHHGHARYVPAPVYYHPPPPVYYVPRPAYYYPPPQPGVTIVFPLGGIF